MLNTRAVTRAAWRRPLPYAARVKMATAAGIECAVREMRNANVKGQNAASPVQQ